MGKGNGKEDDEHRKSNGDESIEIAPIQLLALILKCVLKDRITDEEVERICSTYHKTLDDWWGDDI